MCVIVIMLRLSFVYYFITLEVHDDCLLRLVLWQAGLLVGFGVLSVAGLLWASFEVCDFASCGGFWFRVCFVVLWVGVVCDFAGDL